MGLFGVWGLIWGLRLFVGVCLLVGVCRVPVVVCLEVLCGRWWFSVFWGLAFRDFLVCVQGFGRVYFGVVVGYAAGRFILFWVFLGLLCFWGLVGGYLGWGLCLIVSCWVWRFRLVVVLLGFWVLGLLVALMFVPVVFCFVGFGVVGFVVVGGFAWFAVVVCGVVWFLYLFCYFCLLLFVT